MRAGDLLAGWRHILAHPSLRRLFLNTVLVNGLIMATAPLVAVLMLGRLGFAPWQYGLAFGAPCVGGLLGARLARRLVARFGQRRVMLGAGTLRACWSVGLAFVGAGAGGLALVVAVQLGLVTCVGIFNPVFAMTALWGLLAAAVGPRAAIAVAGALMLATPLLLPRRGSAAARDGQRAAARAAPVGAEA